MSAEHADNFLARYTLEAEKHQAKLIPVKLGTLEQLKELVELVSTKKVSRFSGHMLELVELVCTKKARRFSGHMLELVELVSTKKARRFSGHMLEL